jgi:hypothetical protein
MGSIPRKVLPSPIPQPKLPHPRKTSTAAGPQGLAQVLLLMYNYRLPLQEEEYSVSSLLPILIQRTSG